jgi:hypothetical protein
VPRPAKPARQKGSKTRDRAAAARKPGRTSVSENERTLTFCRAGFAGRGTTFARSTKTLHARVRFDPRRSLGSAS